jgi:crotonobetainyl-CoA:carnitine CoA-transferase CaiB-like acyl-CoA transferase
VAGVGGLVPGDPPPLTRAGGRTAGTTLAGVFAALGVLAALHRRDGGHDQPQYLSVSLWGAAMWWSWRDVTMLANTGEPWFDYSDLGSRYSLYSTKDERVILIAVSEQRFWMRFCEILGLPEAWHDRGEWTRSGMDHGEGPAHDDERLQIARQMRTRDLGDWIAAFEEADLPFAPILTIDEALASEHASANAVLRETTLANEPAQIPAIPVRFGTPDQPDDLSPMSEPPGLGTHSEEIRAVLGLSTAADRTPPDA